MIKMQKKHSLKTQNRLGYDTEFGIARTFKINIINMFRALSKRVDSVQEQAGTLNKEMETPRKCQKSKTL